MEDLIKALTILLKYGNPDYPIHCSHEQMYVNIPSENVSPEDREELDKLGFFCKETHEDGENWDELHDDLPGFVSYKYGSI